MTSTGSVFRATSAPGSPGISAVSYTRSLVATAGCSTRKRAPSSTWGTTILNEDFLELLSSLLDAEARFLVIGAYAVGIHGRPRATKDLDVWVEASPENATRVLRALRQFGAPLGDLAESDLESPGTGFKMGLPPRRIDILTQIEGITFAEAWPNRIEAEFGDGVRCPVIGLADIITNKRAAGRPQDLADVAVLERISKTHSRE